MTHIHLRCGECRVAVLAAGWPSTKNGLRLRKPESGLLIGLNVDAEEV